MCPPGDHHMYYVHLAFVRFEQSMCHGLFIYIYICTHYYIINDLQTYTQNAKYIILTRIQSGMVKTKKLKIIT